MLYAQIEAVSPWAQFGLAGAVIGVLFWYLGTKDKSSAAERKEAREDIKQLSEQNERTAQRFSDDVKQIAAQHDKTVQGISERFAELHEKTLTVIAKSEKN